MLLKRGSKSSSDIIRKIVSFSLSKIMFPFMCNTTMHRVTLKIILFETQIHILYDHVDVVVPQTQKRKEKNLDKGE